MKKYCTQCEGLPKTRSTQESDRMHFNKTKFHVCLHWYMCQKGKQVQGSTVLVLLSQLLSSLSDLNNNTV